MYQDNKKQAEFKNVKAFYFKIFAYGALHLRNLFHILLEQELPKACGLRISKKLNGEGQDLDYMLKCVLEPKNLKTHRTPTKFGLFFSKSRLIKLRL